MFEENAMLSMRFPQKLWRIVNECESGAITWGTSGLTVLLDYKRFQDEYLDGARPVFKTRNITSFIRQLNLYGFRKVTAHARDSTRNSRDPDVHEFLHDDFRAGRIDLLARVCRKAGARNRTNSKRGKAQDAVARTQDFVARTTGNENNASISRLQLCQLALTRTLEQYTREYRQEKFLDGLKSYANAMDTGESRQIRPVLYNFGICLTPVDENNVQWTEQQVTTKCINCHCLQHIN